MSSPEWEPDIGDEVILQGTFENRAGVHTTPTTLAGWVRVPTKPTVTVVPVVFQVTGVGIAEATFSPTVEGVHWWRIEGTGAVKAAGEEYFTVRKRRVTP